MRRYVATLQLKRVTDGDRTFWHWQSTFDVPRGREREFEDLVGVGVYEGGFEGLRAYLRRGTRSAPRRIARARGGRIRRSAHPRDSRLELRRPGSPAVSAAVRARPRARRGAHPPDGDRRQLHRRLRARGAVPHARAAGAARHGGGRRGRRRRRRGGAPPARRSGGVCVPAPRGLCGRAHHGRRPGRRAARPRRRRDRRRGDAQGHDRGVPIASHPPRARGRRRARARRRGRGRAAFSASGRRPWAPRSSAPSRARTRRAGLGLTAARRLSSRAMPASRARCGRPPAAAAPT